MEALSRATLASRVAAALAMEAPETCPITHEPEDGETLCDIPAELRGLVCLYAELKANFSNRDDAGIVWTWKTGAIEAVKTIIDHSLRVGGDHGRVYIELYGDWKYAAKQC